ncbi:MAG: hypothetical protein JNM07_00545 [Phycisphaerae bacterium]|nr:hypothetical protein [Phycisphaerae bacterium]
MAACTRAILLLVALVGPDWGWLAATCSTPAGATPAAFCAAVELVQPQKCCCCDCAPAATSTILESDRCCTSAPGDSHNDPCDSKADDPCGECACRVMPGGPPVDWPARTTDDCSRGSMALAPALLPIPALHAQALACAHGVHEARPPDRDRFRAQIGVWVI